MIFLQIGRFARDLRRVERNVFGIFLSLDLDEAVNRLFHCFAEFARDRSRALLRVMV